MKNEKVIVVIGAGNRGTHGCQEDFVVRGTVEKSTVPGFDVKVTGEIVDVFPCDFCQTKAVIGDKVQWTGWVTREDYYGHHVIQI